MTIASTMYIYVPPFSGYSTLSWSMPMCDTLRRYPMLNHSIVPSWLIGCFYDVLYSKRFSDCSLATHPWNTHQPHRAKLFTGHPWCNINLLSFWTRWHGSYVSLSQSRHVESWSSMAGKPCRLSCLKWNMLPRPNLRKWTCKTSDSANIDIFP